VQLTTVVDLIKSLVSGLQDALDLWELSVAENDEATFVALTEEMQILKAQVEKLEFQKMFSGEMDPNNAYLEIQSGAGGTEAQDWASMLMRMYLRWGHQNNFETEILDEAQGDVAGIKGVTIKFTGSYAFGWLRTETGVHRLVRKSPFNSDNKRHTSFASVFISPEVNEDIDIEINSADLRVDTFRAAGAGGQHVNKTDSAIRITHIPTGIVVQSQNQRSQHQNRAEAMKRLQGKLYEMELLARDSTKQALEAAKTDVAWGHQIRSYVLDQSRIKDLRTNLENSNTTAVLDGDLNEFMEASLKTGL
jgi:peptide chain release factor 2